MRIKELEIKDIYEITLSPIVDQRGYFMRTFDNATLAKYNISGDWLQESQSRSIKKGIIRGLHFQLPPYTEAKLVRCLRGAIFDVFVDLRKDSATFARWGSVLLSEENHKMIYIPRGFAHGFCTLTEVSEVFYKMDNYYNEKAYSGIIWNDPDIGIHWPETDPLVSEKDAQLQTLDQFRAKYGAI